jgi:hypothetical protein
MSLLIWEVQTKTTPVPTRHSQPDHVALTERLMQLSPSEVQQAKPFTLLVALHIPLNFVVPVRNFSVVTPKVFFPRSHTVQHPAQPNMLRFSHTCAPVGGVSAAFRRHHSTHGQAVQFDQPPAAADGVGVN